MTAIEEANRKLASKLEDLRYGREYAARADTDYEQAQVSMLGDAMDLLEAIAERLLADAASTSVATS